MNGHFILEHVIYNVLRYAVLNKERFSNAKVTSPGKGETISDSIAYVETAIILNPVRSEEEL